VKGTKINICEDLTPTRYKLLQLYQKAWKSWICLRNKWSPESYLQNEWFTVRSSNDLFKLDIDANWHELGVPFLAGLHAELVDAAESFGAFSGGDD